MMKTTKAKTISKPKKTATVTKTTAKKKVTLVKKMPTEDEIREKAREIYYERVSRGEHGTAEGDWREAEELLKG
jgi:hypothetical protein